MNVLFVCLTIESLWDVDRDVSTAIPLVFIRTIAWWRLAVLQSKRRDQHLKAILSWDKQIKRSFLSYTTMNNIYIFNDKENSYYE